MKLIYFLLQEDFVPANHHACLSNVFLLYITNSSIYFRTARVYSNYRWARILINELIWLNISKLSSFSVGNELQQRRSLEVISKMATDICCSVSSHFRRHNIVNFRTKKVPPISAVFLLLFPLAVAAGAVGVSEELHNWAIKVLFIIGNTMGSK